MYRRGMVGASEASSHTIPQSRGYHEDDDRIYCWNPTDECQCGLPQAVPGGCKRCRIPHRSESYQAYLWSVRRALFTLSLARPPSGRDPDPCAFVFIFHNLADAIDGEMSRLVDPTSNLITRTHHLISIQSRCEINSYCRACQSHSWVWHQGGILLIYLVVLIHLPGPQVIDGFL